MFSILYIWCLSSQIKINIQSIYVLLLFDAKLFHSHSRTIWTNIVYYWTGFGHTICCVCSMFTTHVTSIHRRSKRKTHSFYHSCNVSEIQVFISQVAVIKSVNLAIRSWWNYDKSGFWMLRISILLMPWITHCLWTIFSLENWRKNHFYTMFSYTMHETSTKTIAKLTTFQATLFWTGLVSLALRMIEELTTPIFVIVSFCSERVSE